MSRSAERAFKFQERSIKILLKEMDSIHFALDFEQKFLPDPDFSRKEIIEAKKHRFEQLAARIFNLCMVYLESKNLNFYLKKFDEDISPFFADKILMFSSYTFLDQSSSAITHAVLQFLNSFVEFGGEEEEDLTGLDFLENILQNTAVIIREQNIVPTSESQVYKAVKIVCQATFPDAKFPTESFQQTARCYKPDILIPTLRCAVEYKYATTENRLVTTIDEILIDVQGYSGNNSYINFYAVFYATSGVMSELRFQQIWLEKQFPDNWKGILVHGN